MEKATIHHTASKVRQSTFLPNYRCPIPAQIGALQATMKERRSQKMVAGKKKLCHEQLQNNFQEALAEICTQPANKTVRLAMPNRGDKQKK